MSIAIIIGSASILGIIAEYATSSSTRSRIKEARRRAHNAAVMRANSSKRRSAGRIYY